jgi:hypothetical protein
VIAWAITAALALATHYFAAFVLIPEAVWLLLMHRGLRAYIAMGVVGATGAALVPLARHQADLHTAVEAGTVFGKTRTAAIQFVAGERRPEEGHRLLELAILAAVPLTYLVIVAAVGACLARPASDRERRGVVITASVAVAAVAVPWLASAAGPGFFSGKNVIAALVPALLAAGIALASRVAGRAGLVGMAAVFAAGLAMTLAMLTTPAMQRRDWRAAAARVPTGDAAVIVAPSGADDPLLLYLRDAGARRMGSTWRAARIEVFARDPDAPAPPPPPGFRPAGREVVERLTRFTLLAEEARTVTRADLAALSADDPWYLAFP